MPKSSDRGDPIAEPFDKARWFVVHTKPRCEKKFSTVLKLDRFKHYLPLVNSTRRYGARDRIFKKPLFPGYVFAEISPEKKSRIYTHALIVRAIWVEDQALFLRQLEDIRLIVASGLAATLKPLIKKGARVRINAGPLWGVEGYVENPKSPKGVLVAMDVLQQGVLVPVPPEHITILE
jgi:transcription antitermination factor NusG